MQESEKRRSKRLDVDLTLRISNLFKQDNVFIKNIDSPIQVENISKHGIGFTSEAELEVNYYFNAKIRLGDNENLLYTVVKIIRKKDLEDGGFFYGCEFIGLAPVLDFIFDNYESSLDK